MEVRTGAASEGDRLPAEPRREGGGIPSDPRQRGVSRRVRRRQPETFGARDIGRDLQETSRNMSDLTRPPEAPHEPEGPNDSIARLLRVAGLRPTVPEERLERVRQTVHAGWRAAVRRERRRRLIVTGLPLAAALLVAVGAGLWLRTERGVAPLSVAVIERTEGSIQLRGGARASSDTAPGSALPAGTELVSG